MQTINNYTIDETKWQLRGGNGECNIATKKGKKYFIKRLIKLKYPVSDLLPQKVKAEKIRECTEWLRRRNAILKALPGDGTGNVVKPIEYFREGPFYYEVANMVEIASLETDEIQKKSVKDKALIMLTAATSIADIHAAGIVHGDLDPGNILKEELITLDD